MKRVLFLLLPAVVVLLAQSCEDEPTKPDTSKAQLNGSVVKSNGQPLDSAEVVLLFHTGPGSGSTTGEPTVFPNPASVNTTLRFTVPAPNTFVSIRALDPINSVTAAAPLNSVMQAGEHMITWNLKEHNDSAHTIRNGWYHIRMDVGGQVQTSPLLINAESSTPHAIADSLGRFFIDYRYILRDSTADHVDANGNVVGRFSVVDTVTMVVRRNGYPTQRRTIGIDRSKSTDVKFTF